ncbi:MAG: excinuclease ABC subunit UvrA [Cryobacterium sp.]|nr:excinuclease ABC subunit UvrA [Oligoflexia bacterium]
MEPLTKDSLLTKKSAKAKKSSKPIPAPFPDEAIVVKGARAHNLKNITVTIPRDTLTVITGLSGSGKSSLAFDTIYAEGQRRYVESLSAYARQFLEQVAKPEVDSIDGLSPTISIEQKTVGYNPRSTVGTVTELWDYLRLLYARVAKPFCYECGKPIQSQSPQQITDQVLAYAENTKLAILAPIVRGRKGEYQKELVGLRQRGFVRVRIDGEVLELSDEISLDKNKKHHIDVYVDRLIIKGDRGVLSTRVSDSVELALKLGEGQIILEIVGTKENEEILLSEKFACRDCGISYPAPEPRTFSFNSPMGACPTCDGLGIDRRFTAAAEESDEVEDRSENPVFLDEVTPDTHPCPDCKGDRLRIESRYFKLVGKGIADVARLSLTDLQIFFQTLKLSSRDLLIGDRIVKEINERIQFLNQVGVGYLSLSRQAATLSGGESQRIRLATQIGSSLVGVIYVLDEPSIGLHQRDNDRLIETLKRLRDLGNTVIVVEHDEDTMEEADFLIDMGPAAGVHGGKVMAAGTYAEVRDSKESLTAKYLRGDLRIEVPNERRPINRERILTIEGAHSNNLKDITVEFPLGTFTAVTGVSGSGKSTLVIDTLFRTLARAVYGAKIAAPKMTRAKNVYLVDKVVDIDQSPIGRTPRSNPVTYTGIFSFIRDLLAQLPEAQIRGYKPGRFSFNVKGGRCENCEGAGLTKIEMHFLPDVFVMCEVCKGKRYNRETLDIRYKGKNIADILALTIEEAHTFFEAIPWIKSRFGVLNDVGLGYLQLGQSATTLSGGEAQRIKLSKELSKRGTGKTVYILDEPSTGLHFEDVRKLISMLQILVDQGNTVIIIEHNLDMIKVADWVIDVGPEGGSLGGNVVAEGTPEVIAEAKNSYTGKYLKEALKRDALRAMRVPDKTSSHSPVDPLLEVALRQKKPPAKKLAQKKDSTRSTK